jgi:hypothetical protein
MEAAEALRNAVGPTQFWDAIRRVLQSAGEIRPTVLGTALYHLIDAGVQVVVNLNYTRDFLDLVAPIFRVAGRQVRVIDRFHLGSFNFHELLHPPEGVVHVVYLHGFVDPLSTDEPGVVLDRKSYDEATLATAHYMHLLVRLFQDFTVISVGASWMDVPLRSAAAQAVFDFPIASRTHYAILPQTEDPNMDLWQERALVSSYSVRPLHYVVENRVDHSEAGRIIQAIATPQLLPNYGAPPTDEDLLHIADILDQWGDYEAAAQGDWMAINWQVLTDAVGWRSNDNLTPELWMALARIERHLRHFLWFYMPPTDKGRAFARSRLWDHVASLWSCLPPEDQTRIWDPQHMVLQGAKGASRAHSITNPGLFEFALGAYEVQYELDGIPISGEAEHWRSKLEGLCAYLPTSLLSRRVALAQRVWAQRTPDGVGLDYLDLRRSAAHAAWEALEAKIALDQLQAEFLSRVRTDSRKPREWGESARRLLLALGDDACGAARVAGCFRREVGAVVLSSFIAPLQQAERNLIAIHRRFVESSSRLQELSMLWWIYIGFLGVFCDKHRPVAADSREAFRWLTQRCGAPDVPGKELLTAIRGNSIPHWRKFHEPAADLVTEILDMLESGET